jgi:membrane protein
MLLVVLWTPVIFLWSWWTQHFLLRGAVGWRPLLTGAIAMTVGLVGLRVFAAFWLSRAIVYNYAVYGPLGLVFVVLNWLVAISIVMLGGPVLGAALHERRVQEQEAARAHAASAEQVAGLRRAAERLIPPPRDRKATPPTDDAHEE